MKQKMLEIVQVRGLIMYTVFRQGILTRSLIFHTQKTIDKLFKKFQKLIVWRRKLIEMGNFSHFVTLVNFPRMRVLGKG